MDNLEELAAAVQRQPRRFRPRRIGWAGRVMGFLLVAVCVIALAHVIRVDSEKARSAAVKSVAETFTLPQLADEYRRNALAAESRFTNRPLAIVAPVASVSRTIVGTPFVKLDGPVMAMCYFGEADLPALQQLVKGQGVIVEGRCTGKTLDTITLEDCRLK